MGTELLNLVKEVRASGPQGCGAFLTLHGEQEISIFEGSEPAGSDSLWALGSVTMTFTATALAALVLRGTVNLETPLGEVLGTDAGPIADRTLLALATHRSGLPRGPASKLGGLRRAFSSQPYADLDEAELVQALTRVKPTPAGTFAYSSFGYLILGVALSRASGLPLSDLIRREVLEPLHITGIRVGSLEPDDPYLEGYSTGRRRPWWVQPVPAAGGMAATLPDLRTWAEANLHPERTSITDALRLAQAEHRPGGGLGWMFAGPTNTVWHNGADAGSYALVVVDRSLDLAFGAVANCWSAKEPETTVNSWLRLRMLGLQSGTPGGESLA